jgi:hypothetical protein
MRTETVRAPTGAPKPQRSSDPLHSFILQPHSLLWSRLGRYPNVESFNFADQIIVGSVEKVNCVTVLFTTG